jgi:RNA ligase (TIGR02306 family)
MTTNNAESSDKHDAPTVSLGNDAPKARALASIRVIAKVDPIPNADAIEVATVDGWKVVVKKGEFAPGDRAVYFEIDSFLPIKTEFEFLRPSSYRKLQDGSEGFRLRTIKLRGQVSQGLLIPVPESLAALPAGADVTENLGVTKFEQPIPAQLAGDIEGVFPTYIIPKTDEERIQNLADRFEEFRAAGDWVVREKLDGSSITFFHHNGDFGVCGRNYRIRESDKVTAWRLAATLDIKSRLGALGDYAIQGELAGPGVQGNPYKLTAAMVYVFSVYDISEQRYADDSAMTRIAEAVGLPVVPLFHPGMQLPGSIDDVLEMANMASLLSPKARAEGLVFRHYKDGGRIHSFKAISNAYLLKQKD